MMDPIHKAVQLLEQAKVDRLNERHEAERVRQEAFTLRRQLEQTRERNGQLEATIATLEYKLEAAERTVERSQRAARDHVTRTT